MKYTSLALLGIILVIQKPTVAQTNVFIPDAMFRDFLNDTYPTFMDASGDSLIVDSAATLTDTFNCSQQFISDLTGIEYFIHITELSCDSNQLISLPDLSVIVDLSILICSENRLTSLPDLSANTELSVLDCHYNQLTSLPDLSGNVKLTFLECSDNQLNGIPDLLANTELSVLNCSYNLLTSLPDLSGNVKLTSLKCSDNQLTNLPDLSANTFLSTLYCWENQLTSLPNLSANTELSTLDCAVNLLTGLPDLSANTALHMLWCYNNQLTSLSDFSANVALSHLDCNNNQLVSLPDLSANTELSILFCAYNQLTSLPDLSTNAELWKLDCAHNQITSISDFSSSIILSDLIFSYNQLSSLPDLSANIHLHRLRYDHNKLDFSDAKALRAADTISSLYGFEYAPQNPFGNGGSITLNEGETLTLSIASQDSALSYQWFRDNIAIAGATDTLLVIPEVTAADIGSYTCRSYGTALESPPMNYGPGISEFVSEPFHVTIYIGIDITNPEITGTITIYPNPNRGIFNITIDLIPPGFKEIRIYNSLGQPVFIEELKHAKVTFTRQLDLERYPAGIYYLQLTSDEEIVMKQILIE